MEESPLRSPLRWTEHIGTVLTLGYLVLIAVGMFHSVLGYAEFGINILDYAEAGDFLLAPFRDPMVLLVTGAPLGLAWAYLTYAQRISDRALAKRRAEGKPRAWWESSEKAQQAFKKFEPLMKLSLGLFWLWVSASLYQRLQARAVMRGESRQITVYLTDGTVEQGTPRRPLSLIGATSRFVFLFRTETWRVEIVPTDNVLRMVPVGALPDDMVKARDRTLRRLDSLTAPTSGGKDSSGR